MYILPAFTGSIQEVMATVCREREDALQNIKPVEKEIFVEGVEV